MKSWWIINFAILVVLGGVKSEGGQKEQTTLQTDVNNTANEVSDKSLEIKERVPDPVKKEVLDTGEDVVNNEVTVADNEADKKDKNSNLEETKVVNENKFSLTGLIMFIVSVVMILLIILLILLSTYYRFYLYKHKQAPFEAPTILRLFFPKPVNYEHEITVLCSKYMNN